ncbi:hypothetical protein B484DRAFT_399210 [Ochromonadaceae sp. CCMP2298]|nr:hypothetical protein B484DRAFT_399210 [Ochromonadaceae sp. CCMP2298]
MKRKAEAIQEEGAASSVVEAKEQEEQEQEEGGQAVKQEPEDNYDAGTQERGARVKCPYLDTVDRHVIDFDSEKLCSVTLTNMNVYVCLVCGKYFQGRGKQTPAFTHSVQAGHFVFMNLGSGRAYCLPDGYEVQDASLLDVQSCLSPRYALHEIAALNSGTSLARDVYGTSYLPGFVGLNNLARTDYLNALLHALAHVSPFRDFWLQPQLYSMAKSNIVQLFGLTLRKIWSSSNFKSIVSPQELMQEVVVQSGRRFGIQQRAECLDLFVWLMDQLHRGLGRAAAEGAPAKARRGGGMSEASVLYEPFLGVIEVTSLTKQLVSGAEELGEAAWGEGEGGGWVRSVTRMPFTYLSLDIPPCPLFRDSEGGLVIPQVP